MVRNGPARILSAEQKAAMLAKEEIVLRERAKGKSFYKIEQEFKIHNPDRVWRRAIQRDENIGYRRAEAIRLEEQRLDAMQEGLWDRVLAGEPRAVEVALKVLERRARMLGLDFADYLSGKMVEVEEAKVRLMGAALAEALDVGGLTPEARRAVLNAFFERLRAAEASADGEAHVITGLAPADRDLL